MRCCHCHGDKQRMYCDVKLENASPVEPKTIEAVILSQIDNLDAKLGAIFIHKNETLQTDNSEQYLRLDEKPINFYFHDLKK